MSHVPHDLHEEFPEDTALLHTLKLSDARFQKLSESYHEINRAIHRAETDVEPIADSALEDLKKQRLAMLDEVASLLAAARV